VAPVAEAVEAPAAPAASLLSQAAELLLQTAATASQAADEIGKQGEESGADYDSDASPHDTDVASVREGDEGDEGGGGGALDASAAPRGDEPPPPEKTLLRRSGLSVTSLVDRSGDLSTKSQRVQHDNVQALISALISSCPLPSKSGARSQGPDRKGQIEAAMKRHGGASSKANRDLASNCRTFCFEQWGGEPWLKIFLALGDVSKEVVGIANEVLAEIVLEQRGAPPSETPVAGPRLAPRAAAASRGEPVPEVRGITHAKRDPKLLREKAKRLDKRMEKWTKAWEAGRRHNETCSWDTLVKQRQEPR